MTAHLDVRRRRRWRTAAVLAVLLVGTLVPAASAHAMPGAGMIATIKATPAPTQPLIAFRSDRSGHLNIWVMQADGSNPRNLTHDDAQGPNTLDTQPAWGPGGHALVYVRGEVNVSSDLWAITADGKHRWRLTHDALAAQPAWAPRFFKIAFISIRGDSASTLDGQDIFTLDLLSGEQRRLTFSGGAFPQWSPDGSRIAFFSRRDGGPTNSELYVMNANGSNQTRLTDNPANDFVSTWSPDGTRLAFARTDAAGSQIWILDLVTMVEKPVTSLPGLKVKPDWSPDGRYLLFHGTTAGTIDNEILRVRTDGSDLLRLTTNPANDSQPDWQPRLL